MLRNHTRRVGIVALLALLLTTLGLTAAPSVGAADIVVPISWTVNASTHIKSVNLDVTVPPGNFTGTVDLTTGNLTGTLTLPPAAKTISFLGLPLATATFSMSPAGPISGHVDLVNNTVSVTASFNFNITSATLSLLPKLNLVGNNCHGSTPITVNMTGAINLTGANTFSSTYTIPKFSNCGFLVTPLLNLIIPGPGNTFTATFAPPA
jgi:hypothetical protein